MSRIRKAKSKILEIAHKRLNGLEAIAPTLDLGNGVTEDAFKAVVDDTQAKLDTYAEILAQADSALNDFISAETELREWNLRVAGAVASKYGSNSNEIEKIGLKRRSDKKRPVRKPKPPKAS